MNTFLQKLDKVTSTSLELARVEHVLEREPATADTAFTKRLKALAANAPADIDDGFGTLVGAVGGAIWWREERLLGAIVGASLGRNVPALLGKKRGAAMRNMLTTGAGTVGALVLPSNKALGFALGWIAGGALALYGGLK